MALIHGEVQSIEGYHHDSQLIHFGDGYFYTRHVDRRESQFVTLRCRKWRLNGVKCRGRAIMSRDKQYYAVTRNHTGHVADPYFALEREMRRRVLERTAAGDAAPFAMIVRDEGVRGHYPVEVRSRLPVARIRSAMWRARMASLPRIPHNLPVLAAYLACPQYSHITETVDAQDSIMCGSCGLFSEGTVSVIFMSRRAMMLLQRAREVFMDGTFRKRPRKPNTSQIFSISMTWAHAATNTKHTIVLARVFMQRRTERAYLELFNFLRQVAPAWNPEVFHCDHERALVNAIRAVFPNARVVSCLFHYSVDVFKYAKDLGLAPLMEGSWVMDSIVRCLCVIPLLPTHLLYQGLLEVGYWARNSGYMHFPQVRDLFQYLEREWMGRINSLSVFGSADRTNNISESVNAALEWYVRQDRPNVYELIRCFVLQEDQFMVDIHALSDGRDAGRARAVSSLYNDERIRNLSDSLTENRITVIQFLRSASRTYQAPYDQIFG